MTATATHQERSRAPSGRGRPVLPRAVWVLASVVALLTAGVLLRLWWSPAPDGLPDAGWFVVNGLPVLRLTTLLAGGALVGFGLSAVALDPDARTRLTRAGRRDADIAVVAAIALAAASVAVAVFTLADVLGVGLAELTAPGLLATYFWDVEVSRAHLVSAGLAMVAAVGLRLSRSLGPAAASLAVGVVAVGIPSLTGHAAGLGSHSLAMVSGFLHAVAAATWGGGVVVLATHALRRAPRMAQRVRRFGGVAIVSVVLLAATGTASAATRLDTASQLITTAYGQLVLAKVLALGVALLLGRAVRMAWRTRTSSDSPNQPATRGRLLSEVAVLGGALGLAVVLAGSAFPREPVQLPSVGEDLVGYVYPPAPTFTSVAFGWHPDWVWLTAALVAVALYGTGFTLLRARGDTWPVGRLVAWVLGWLVVVWATCAGVAWYAPVAFSLHMVSHMALAMMAPVLLVLGGPFTLALRVLPPATSGRGPREWISSLLHSPLARFLTHPLFVLLIYTVGLYGLYYTSLYADLMSYHLGHLLMQVHFLVAGYLFYWVVIGVDAGPRRLAYPARLLLLMASLVIHSFFALPMMMAQTPMVPGWYELVAPPWLTDPLGDTRTAGGIAWGFGEIPTLIVAVALGIQWARSDEREARRVDRRADRDGDADLRSYNEHLARLSAADAAARDTRAMRKPAEGRADTDHTSRDR